MNNKQLIQDFSNYLILEQDMLKYKVATDLSKYYNKVKIKDGFVFARGELPIMLVAHLDTVHKEQCGIKDIFTNLDYSIVNSPKGIGGDDRCGVFMIMSILKDTDFRPSILFVEDEEIGSIGAKKFVKSYNKNNLDLDFIIELDRRGGVDSVFYDLDNQDFEDYINSFGFKTAIGSFTDICELCPVLDVAGVNLSCGYYQEHTLSHYINVNEMMETTRKVIEILKAHTKRNRFEWKEKQYFYNNSFPYYNTYYNNYSYGSYDLWCDNCGKVIKEEDYYSCETDFGEVLCKECATHYGYHNCDMCGVLTDSTKNLCRDCEEYERQHTHSMFD